MIRKCGFSNSPSGTPATAFSASHHQGRQRMTLGMLLRNPIEDDRKPNPRQSFLRLGIVNHDNVVVGRNTLNNLMMSSSNIFYNDNNQAFMVQKRAAPLEGHGSRKLVRHTPGTRGLVTASTSFRIRVFKRAWRPVLGVIPEGKAY